MHKLYNFFLVLFVFLLSIHCSAQTPQWAQSIGSPGEDMAKVCKVAPNGNVAIAGYFTGSVDFDPGPGAHILNSNGEKDCFIACYSPSGSFIWAFNIGGDGIDIVYDLAFDLNNDILVAGSFRGQNVDFDPGTGTAFLSEVGNTVYNPYPYAGEIFFAKYTSSGNYVWAMATGSASVFEYGTAIAADANGNIYAAGRFHGIIDVDPSPNIYPLDASTGKTCFLAKYSPTGQLIRAFNFGGNGDNFIRGIKIDPNGYVYTTGYFQGLNVDFDPSPNTHLLNAIGGNDLYLAKYDTAFDLQFAFRIGSAGMDESHDLDLDAYNNIYITGYVGGPSVFDPVTSQIIPAAGSGLDAFVAKYNSSGQYQWAKILGGQGTDMGREIVVEGSSVYFAGEFENTVDFDASASVANLTSSGAADVFVARYDLNGNYQCAFSVGSWGIEANEGLAIDNASHIYIAGAFSNSNIDFDPSANSSLFLSSNGLADIHLAKYSWDSCGNIPIHSPSPPTFCNLSASFNNSVTGCKTVLLTANTANASGNVNYNWDFGDGSTASGNPVTHTYTNAGTYTIRLIATDSLNCADTTTSTINFTTAKADFSISNDTICLGQKVQFNNLSSGQGNLSYFWDFGDGNVSSASSPSHVYPNTGTFTVSLIVDDGNLCPDTMKRQISVGEKSVYEETVAICKDSSFLFGDQWIDSAGVYTETFSGSAGCDSVVILTVYVNTPLNVSFSHTPVIPVMNEPTHFNNTSANTNRYLWEFGDGDTSTEINPVHQYPVSGTYYVCLTGWNPDGCEGKFCKSVSAEVSPAIDVPAAFSPNGDGANDILFVRGGGIKEFSLKIYNRWGQMIFETRDLKTGWDGTYKGQHQDMETVAYILQGVLITGETVQKQGNITIIR